MGKGLNSYTILQNNLFIKVLLGCSVIWGTEFFRILFPKERKGWIKVCRRGPQWLPPFTQFVIQLLQRKRWQSQKLPYSLLPSSENVAYRVRIWWHSDMPFAMCLSPNVSKLQEELEVTSAHLPLPGLGYMIELLEL